MIVYRIAATTPDYSADDLSGKGAASTGGRWNRDTVPVVYCAESIALAYLETLVHLVPGGAMPRNRCLIEVEIPARIWNKRWVAPSDQNFPADWNVHPPGKGSIDYGTAWLISRPATVLMVPSIVIPQELNILINPLRHDATAIKATNKGIVNYDHRLFP